MASAEPNRTLPAAAPPPATPDVQGVAPPVYGQPSRRLRVFVLGFVVTATGALLTAVVLR